MSDKPNPIQGLFVNRKSESKGKSSLSPSSKKKNVSKRWWYIGFGIVTLAGLSSALFGSKPQQLKPPKPKDEGTIQVTPPNSAQQNFQAQYGQKLQAIQQQLQQLQQQNASKDSEIKQLLQQKNQHSGSLSAPGVVPPPLPPGESASVPKGLPMLGAAPANGTAPSQSPTLTLPPELPSPAAAQKPLSFTAPPLVGTSASNAEPNVKATVHYRKNPDAGMLPAGAFAPVALLNGLDAGTSSATQANPMPVLMDVLSQAVLPGLAKYRLKNCFILGTGYGDLSAERVYVRFSRMSCVDKADGLLLSANVSGYLVDSDGKLGLRGTVVDRQGAKLGKALLAGFAQGLAGALGTAQGAVTSSATTGLTTSTLTGTGALRASGLGGAQVAASQLAEFYLKQAESIFPVISINTGRTGTVVFTSSTSLHWESVRNDYTKNVTPQ